MATLPAGKFNRRITIERYAQAQDSYGEEVQTWTTHAVVWASKQDVSDKERIAASEVSAEITTRFVVRNSAKTASVNPKDRIVLDGVNYNIYGVKELGRREGVEITAAARADG